jgi:EAL domain-containing protein (putative c-di-GMP-specific phosphodiesterase class I)
LAHRDEKRLMLQAQPASDQKGKGFHDLELLSQLEDSNGDPIAARLFIPLVVELKLQKAFDQLVVEKTVHWLQQHCPPAPLAINLTQSVLEDAEFYKQLLAQIPPELASKVAFEIPEHFLRAWPQACAHFIAAARSKGCLIGFDHFGRHLSEKETLRQYQPDYIKLPLGFSEAINQQDEKTLSYLASLIEMAYNLDIEVIATGIENEQTLEGYQALGIRWFQGYYLYRPETLDHWIKRT